MFKARLSTALALTFATSLVAAQDMNKLPDGETTKYKDYSAWLVGPTAIYGHAALGDSIEAEGFVIERNGTQYSFRLPADQVYEDRRVRLTDIDGDGSPEALIVRANLALGASLALYTIRDGTIELMAENEAIGRRNRWLNPVGIADFSGSGEPLIAAVVTPHLTGSLRFFRIEGKRLVNLGGIDGVTNHINGSRDLDLSRIADLDGDGSAEIVLPSLERTRLLAISFEQGHTTIEKQWDVPSPIERLGVISGGKIQMELRNGQNLTVAL
ncbi:hypothetical protein FE840_013255 [Peteryoungia desertarenae]|uniref:VCBS repeat-containing protein n=1 Tax=Peteryoungia desertarenae TaxID=1813451 RepID=A0ABX6QQE0_9HYPH|nr:hypothetical protein [Peteryoungia desertarenae]QLF70427.1 hypothetical protein FE840_013255 [Peteryoungia desertarenae]